MTFKTAKIGTVSHGTLRTKDLIESFHSTLEGLILINGDFLSCPENFAERDRLNAVLGEAQEWIGKFGNEGFTEDDEMNIQEFLNETLFEALETFAPSFCYFGAHPGDGADFGFWPADIEDIKEQVEFASSKDEEYPPEDFTGEWLHINERGNCTLYCRTKEGKLILDSELWSLV